MDFAIKLKFRFGALSCFVYANHIRVIVTYIISMWMN